MGIEGNAYFYSGGGHTLVGANYVHVKRMAKFSICGSFGYNT